MPICVALSAAGAFPHSLAHLSTLSPFFCTPESPVPIVLSVKPISQPRHLIARALANINKAAPSASIPAHPHTRHAVAYLCSHLRSPPRLFSTSNVANFHQYSDSYARRSLSFHACIVYPTTVVAHPPDCRVARRICRIRPAHARIQQEWSVLMAT
jgi:hypothetical protein